MTFADRSYKKELLDEVDIPFQDIEANMRELNSINTLLGGHAITINGFKQLVGNKKKITVCEIGCGGGDNLVAIAKWCTLNDIEFHCMGIDMKKECIQVAESQKILQGKATWIADDYLNATFVSNPDIIFSSLFCHHFMDAFLVSQLIWMKNFSTLGFFINDLHRHPIAYYSIRFLTKLFSNSYLVKHDAPLSVLRGFTKKEWQLLCSNANIENVTIHWKWAFRYLIISKHA